MKKKITIILCIIFIIFNFIYSSMYIVAANDTAKEDTSSEQEMPKLEEMGVDLQEDSSDILQKVFKDKITIRSDGQEVDAPTIYNNDSPHTASAVVIRFLTFIVEWVNNIPQLAVEATDNDIDLKYFTIYSLVMGEYDFFNLDFFDISADTEDAGIFDVIGGNITEDASIKDAFTGEARSISLGGQIKNQIRSFYIILRNLSLGLSIFILIYIGIRMAISTVASEKSKYKKMIIDWLASIMLVMFMHFIVIIFSYLSGEALELVKRLATAMDVTNIEEGILAGNVTRMGTSSGYHVITSFITVAIFVYYELKFFISYLYRFCEIAILIVVSPLVTITYSIDKVSDNKAQAFQAWFKELSIKYSIQVVHALTYVIFIASAGVIATEVPLFAAFFLLALDKAEKIFRNVLNVKDNNFEKARIPFIDG